MLLLSDLDSLSSLPARAFKRFGDSILGMHQKCQCIADICKRCTDSEHNGELVSIVRMLPQL